MRHPDVPYSSHHRQKQTYSFSSLVIIQLDMKFPNVSFTTWSHDKLLIHMARHIYDILPAVTPPTTPTYSLTSQRCTDCCHTTKTNLISSYTMLPFLTILSNVIPQDREGPKENTTWWAPVAQRDLQ